MPTQVFPIDLRIINRHVLRIPEGIFRVDNGTAYLHVFTILERIIPVLGIILDPDILTMQEQVIRMIHPYIL